MTDESSFYQELLVTSGAWDEIERLRADNEQFHKQAEMNARLLTENADLRGQLSKTDLDNIRISYENEKLRELIKSYTEQHVRLLNELLREFAVKEIMND